MELYAHHSGQVEATVYLAHSAFVERVNPAKADQPIRVLANLGSGEVVLRGHVGIIGQPPIPHGEHDSLLDVGLVEASYQIVGGRSGHASPCQAISEGLAHNMRMHIDGGASGYERSQRVSDRRWWSGWPLLTLRPLLTLSALWTLSTRWTLISLLTG